MFVLRGDLDRGDRGGGFGREGMCGMKLFSTLAKSRRRSAILFKDTFSVAKAAPLGSTLAADVKGTWTVTDTSSYFTISDGKLVCSGGKNASGDPGIRISSITRLVGRTMITNLNKVSASEGGPLIGFDTDAYGSQGADGQSVYFLQPGVAPFIGSYSAMDELNVGDCKVAIVLLSAGALLLISKNPNIWKILGKYGTDNHSILYPLITTFYTSRFSIDKCGIFDLPCPFNTDFGLATQRLAGARSAGDTLTHEKDALIEFIVNSLSTVSSIQIDIRKQDVSHRWAVMVTSGGSLELWENNSGWVNRATAGTVTAGNRIMVIADGSTIRGYINNVLKWTYTSATNFSTATNGGIVTLGTGGAISDLITWPRYLSGAALNVLNRYG